MLDLQEIFEALPVGVWVAEVPSGRVAYANPEFRSILGMDAVSGSEISDAPATYGIADLEGRPYPVERLPFSRVVATGERTTVDDLVIHRADGRRVNVRAQGYPVLNDRGALTHVVIAFIDITAEVRAETERRQTESRLSLAVDHAPIAIWSADDQGVVTVSRGAGLRSLGVESGELVGQNLYEIYRDHPSIPACLRRGLDGESFWYTIQIGDAIYDTWITPLRDASGRVVGVSGLSNDVTAMRRLQANMIQQDRAVALGTLAATVAHEINNPLTFMLGHLDLAADTLDRIEQRIHVLPGEDRGELGALLRGMRDSLEPVRTGTERIKAITAELRTFNRPSDAAVPVDVQAAVISTLKLVGKALESRAELNLNLENTRPVSGDPARLVHVVLNLVVNAMQALPDNRRATNRIWVRTAEQRNRILIEVADNGPGIAEADRERIFEPFHTSKEIGEGSGLGLFVCRNIVSSWSGTISVDERPGGGARFRVSLPAAPGPAAAARAAGSPAKASDAVLTSRSGGRVMIVDDERPVAHLLGLQLRAAGYQVSIETDAGLALQALKTTEPVVDLIYCDLMMKGRSGMDFAAALPPDWAERVVFMTGGAFTTAAQSFREAHADRCVDKPFDIVAETARRLESMKARASPS